METGSLENKQQSKNNREMENASPAVQEQTTPSPAPPSSPAGGGPPRESSVLPSPPSPDKIAQPSAPALLEQTLRTIEQKLSIHTAKEEIITRSLVELEGRISGIEKSLHDIKKAQSIAALPFLKKEEPPDHPGSPRRPHASVSGQSRQPAEGVSAQGKVPSSPQHSATSADFPPPGLMVPDENTGFISGPLDDFEAPLEKEHLLLQGNRVFKSAAGRHKNLYTLALILFFLALFLGLAYYYSTLQEKADKKLMISEEIHLTTVPATGGMENPSPQLTEPQEAQKQEIISTPAALPDTMAAVAETQEEVVDNPPPQQEPQKAASQFTVSVGSFKDRANAIALTSKLTNRGYPARTAQLKQKQLFRVSVGTFSTRNEALDMARILAKKERLPTAVVSITTP